MSLRATYALVSALALLAMSLDAATSRATLLANGSFEAGPNPGASMAVASGSAAITGWVATRAGIRYVGTDWTAAQGTRSIALNGPDAGGIAQTFPSIPRAQYTLRLYMAGDPGTLPDLKTMGAAAAGQHADFSKDIAGMWAWDPGWDLRTWSFLAIAESTTIELYSTMPGTTGPTVDSVSIEVTSMAGVGGSSAAGFDLAPPAPNPARGTSGVEFTVPARVRARVSVFDLAGREVAVLADGDYAPGRHHAAWNARIGGRQAAAGMYLVSMRAQGVTVTRRLLLVR